MSAQLADVRRSLLWCSLHALACVPIIDPLASTRRALKIPCEQVAYALTVPGANLSASSRSLLVGVASWVGVTSLRKQSIRQ